MHVLLVLQHRPGSQPAAHEAAPEPASVLQEEHGLLWVWADSSHNSGAESDAHQVPWPEALVSLPDDKGGPPVLQQGTRLEQHAARSTHLATDVAAPRAVAVSAAPDTAAARQTLSHEAADC